LQVELLLRVGRYACGFLAFWFLFWGVIYEAVRWGKPWDLALLSSLQNWLMFMVCLVFTAILDFLIAHPQLLLRVRKRLAEPLKSEKKGKRKRSEKKKKEGEEGFPLW